MSDESNLLASLKEQAEKLLMVLPGHFKDTPIEIPRKQIHQMYDFDSRNPEVGERARAITRRMLIWISMCEWVLASMNPNNGIKDSEPGIFKWHSLGGVSTFTVYCQDAHHYQMLPMLVTLKGEEFTKTNWNSALNRCYYKSTVDMLDWY